MNKIKLKINDWDGTSLMVTAISDNCEKNFECYAPQAYQPSFYEVSDLETLLKQIAKSCIPTVESNQKIENFSKNEILNQELSQIVGNVYEWNVSDLFSDDFGPSLSPEQYSNLSVEEKLKLAGITIAELKQALGLS